MFEKKGECKHPSMGKGERERENVQADSVLSTELDAGLDLPTPRSGPEPNPRVCHSAKTEPP